MIVPETNSEIETDLDVLFNRLKLEGEAEKVTWFAPSTIEAMETVMSAGLVLLLVTVNAVELPWVKAVGELKVNALANPRSKNAVNKLNTKFLIFILL